MFDTLFVYENYPVDTAALAGEHELAITEFSTREYNHYPLTVAAAPGRELGLRVEYDTEVFDAASIEALIERLERVLVAMTADPTRRLSSIDVLDEGEHARLDGWGQSGGVDRAGAAGGVDSGVVCCAGGPCPGGGGDQLRGAGRGRIASWMRRRTGWRTCWPAHGVGPGERVALLLPRSAEAIVAMLAVLKTGAAYVPIDPAHPDARIGFVLADAAPIAALTTAGLRSRLAGHDLVVIDVDDPGH